MPWKPDYCTVAELRDFVQTDAADDTYLGFAVTAASRAVDQHTGRQFGSVAAEARRYSARWDRQLCRWMVIHDDVQDITGWTVSVAAGAVDVIEREPVNAAQLGRPFERFRIEPESANRPAGLELNEVTITAKWGWTAVPGAVKEGTLLQASRLFARRTSPYGVAGSPDQGSELRLLAKLDPDVAVSLRDYIRWWATG